MHLLTLLDLACLVLIAFQLARGTGQYCPEYLSVNVTKTKTIEVDCGDWWHKGRLCPLTIAYYVKATKRNTQMCCAGLTGQQCNIPVCSNCKPDQVCYNGYPYNMNKKRCFCQPHGDCLQSCMGCDCFPGTCEIRCDDYCACSSGFEGRYRSQNCLTMRDSPNFLKCQMSLKVTYGGKERTVFTGNCSQDNLYSNHQNVSSTVIEWVTQLDPLPDMPPKPSYMRTVKFGVVSTSGTGTIWDARNSSNYRVDIHCSKFTSEQEPVQPLKCTYSHDLRSTTIAHNYRLQVDLKAKGGGYKITRANTNRMYFKGKTGNRTVSVTFDLKAPTHCKLTNTCSKPDYLPVDVGRQIDSNDNPNRYLGWSGWLDSDSGLEMFSYEVYELIPDSDGLLTEKTQPLLQGKQSVFETTFPTYELHNANMYSVVLKVDDAAGNSAYARGLFLWDSSSTVKVNTHRLMTVSDVTSVTEQGDTYIWLTSPVDKHHPVIVNWQGHFENRLHHDKKLLNNVKPWPVDKGFDDVEGERSIEAIPNVRGIVRFHAGYDELKSIALLPPLTDVGLEQNYKLRAPITSGGFIRVLVRATDVLGQSASDWLYVRVDATPPRFVDHTFEKNIDCSGTKLSYCSRIRLHVHDKESGIREIRYIVTDVTQDKELWNGTNKGKQQTENTKQCEGDGSCVCTPFNGCYLRKQVFFFDHCWLVNVVEHAIRVKVTIYNYAGLFTIKELKLGILEGLEGINKCVPTPGGPTTGVIVGIVIAIVLLVVLIVLLILFFITRRREDRPYIPDSYADFNRTLAQTKLYWGKRANHSNPVHTSTNVYDNADDDEEDDVYLYSSLVTEGVADWKIGAGNVTLGDKLPNAKGRFADIHLATLKTKAGRQEVVAKSLKHGGNAETKLLMVAKMNFWATACPQHENILLFIGAVPSVPILLYDLCDLGSLGSWLSSQTIVTEDLADKMITFSLQIARGLQQLHAHKITHRRLGVRNILLKSDDVGCIVAKVTGFGPMRGEVQRGDTDKVDEVIPVKWMSPEQLNLNPGERRKYDANTDVWSFGITVWEIFSKGGSPYPDVRSRELKKHMANGYRMSRPTHCPDVMFEQVIEPCWRDSATSRPTVAALVTKIETLFLCGAPGDGYYYENLTTVQTSGRHNEGFEQDY